MSSSDTTRLSWNPTTYITQPDPGFVYYMGNSNFDMGVGKYSAMLTPFFGCAQGGDIVNGQHLRPFTGIMDAPLAECFCSSCRRASYPRNWQSYDRSLSILSLISSIFLQGPIYHLSSLLIYVCIPLPCLYDEMWTLHAWMAVDIQYGDIVDASPMSSWWSNHLYQEKDVVASDL